MTRILFSLAVIGVAAPLLASAQNVPHLRDVEIRTVVTKADAAGIHSFEYRLSNGQRSDAPLSSFDVSIARGQNTQQLAVDNLFINLGANVRSFADWINNLGMDGSALVPAGCSGPLGWKCTVAVGGWIAYAVGDFAAEIPQGHTRGGFILRSRGLPDIVPGRVRPHYIFVAAGEEATDEDVQAAQEAYQEIIFPVQVVGPVAPPSIFEPLLFTQHIRDLIHEAQTLGWIRSDHVEDALERRLDRLEQDLKRGRLREAVEAGRTFLDLLEDASCGRDDCDERQAITSDADGLLRFNMEYLLTQLQPEVKTKDVEQRGTDPRT